MRVVVMVLALLSSIACGGDSSTAPTTVVGAWSLQSYNGGVLPYTGGSNANGSRDRVTDGTITFDSAGRYVLGITILRTASTGIVSNQDFNEIGSYTGDVTGLVLRPNDFGTGVLSDPPVPAAIAGDTLRFEQGGKLLKFVKR